MNNQSEAIIFVGVVLSFENTENETVFETPVLVKITWYGTIKNRNVRGQRRLSNGVEAVITFFHFLNSVKYTKQMSQNNFT